MGTVLQMVYMDADNVADIIVSYVGADGRATPLDLSPVTRAVLTVRGAGDGGANVVVDSDDTPEALQWGADGNFSAHLGGVLERAGDYTCTIVLYDPGHPNGQVVAHPEAETALLLRVVQV